MSAPSIFAPSEGADGCLPLLAAASDARLAPPAVSRRGTARPRGGGRGGKCRFSAAASNSAAESFAATATFTRGAAAAVAAAADAAAGAKSRRTRVVKQPQHQHKVSRHVRRFRPPSKAPPSGVALDGRHRAWLFHAEAYYQLGDVVAVTEESRVYYAQIRALFLDSELSASCQLTWLVPVDPVRVAVSCDEYQVLGFEPSAYTLGPVDEAPYRALDSVRFVCHCPADYFSEVGAGLAGVAGGKGVVWTTLETEIAAAQG